MATSTISIMAYRAFAPKELSKKQNTVLAFLLKYGSMSNKELAAKIGWPINTITPRVKELRDLGLVELDSIKWDCRTNRAESVWRVRSLGLGGD